MWSVGPPSVVCVAAAQADEDRTTPFAHLLIHPFISTRFRDKDRCPPTGRPHMCPRGQMEVGSGGPFCPSPGHAALNPGF